MLVLLGHTDQVQSLAFAPDGRRLASAGWDGSIRIWDLAGGREVRLVRTPNAHATGVAFLPSGSELAASFADYSGTATHTYGKLAVFPVEPEAIDHGDSIHPIRTWNVRSIHGVNDLAVESHRGRPRLFTVESPDNQLRCWDIGERTAFDVMAEHAPIAHFAVRPDGCELAALTLRVPRLLVWNLPPDARGALIDSVDLGPDAPITVAYSPDGETIVALLAHGRMFWWPPEGPWSGRIQPGHGAPATALAFLPGGRSLLTGGDDGLVHLWDTATQTRRCTWDWRIGMIRCLAVSPDGLTAAGGGERSIVVWDLEA